jgi:hypothetical protein
MPNYTPIVAAAPIKASLSDLIEFRWNKGGITADFLIPGDDDHALRVRFSEVEIVRILDEMPLSTEAETTPNSGLVKDHFAYQVEGSQFWQSQSEAFKVVYKGARHFRFITGWTCIDVISPIAPKFEVVAKAAGGL